MIGAIWFPDESLMPWVSDPILNVTGGFRFLGGMGESYFIMLIMLLKVRSPECY